MEQGRTPLVTLVSKIMHPLALFGPQNMPKLMVSMSLGHSVEFQVRCALALASSQAEEKRPAAACKLRREDCAGSRRDFILGCSNALAASTACTVTDRWFTPHFSVLATFCISRWTADVACPEVCQPVWPACGPPLQ